MNINTQELRKNLGDYSPDEPLGVISDYIVWQLDRMSDKELAETTAKEITDGKFTAEEALEAVTEMAKKGKRGTCAVMSDSEVFRIVREYLHIGLAVPESETVGFVPGSTDIKPVVASSPIADFSIFD